MGTQIFRDTPGLHVLAGLLSQQISPREIPEDQWPQIITLALQHGLGPMLVWVVKQTAPELTGASIWEPVVRLARNSALQFVYFSRVRQQVDTVLASVKVPSIWLKGLVLSHTVYPQPALRSMSDLDVLIPYDQRQLALRTLENSGFQFYSSDSHLFTTDDPFTERISYHYVLRSLDGPGNVIVELHYRLLSAGQKFLSDAQLAWFWGQAQPWSNGQIDFTIPKPEAHLLYLCAHAILQHGEAQSSLRQYFDLHRLITQSELDWDLIIRQAIALGWVYATERALTLAVEFFGTPVPEAVVDQLESGLRSDPHIQHATSLRSPGAQWQKALSACADLPFRGKIEFCLRVLFPPKLYMRNHYSIKPGKLVWPYYLKRWFEEARTISRWFWKRYVG